MKNVDLDFVFGSDDAPMPLPRFEAVTQGNGDAQNPFENFFRDAVIAAAVGGSVTPGPRAICGRPVL